MDSPSTCIHKRCTHRGFTLAETLIAAAVGIMLLGIGLLVTVGEYRAANADKEVETLVVLFEAARSAAMNNIDESQHGVAIGSNQGRQYILFSGSSSANGTAAHRVDQEYELQVASGSISEIVFEQLSGDVAAPGEITLLDVQGGASRSVQINAEGAISW